jgi:hypothetical protein
VKRSIFSLFLLSSVLLSFNLQAKKITDEDLERIEVLNEEPKRPFKMISPISSDKDSVDKAFKKLKEKAFKLNADAIIGLECKAGEKTRAGLLQLKMFGQSSTCQGTAVKWVN